MKYVDAKQRTGVVRWLQQNKSFESFPKFAKEETISLYEIVEHPHFNFCLGDVVMRLTTNQPKINKDESFKDIKEEKIRFNFKYVLKSEPHAENEDEQSIGSDDQEDVASNEDIQSFKREKRSCRRRGREGRSNHCNRPITDLSWIGNVIELKDGQIQVVWADGNISKVNPEDILVVNNEEEEFTFNANDVEIMYNNDALTWAQLEYNEEVEPNQMSLASVLDQIESSESVSQLENEDVLEKCINYTKRKLPIQNMETILDCSVDSSNCSPRRCKAPLAAACKKFVLRMKCVIKSMKPQSSSLGFPQGTLCCSHLHDVLDPYHTLRRSNFCLSASKINANLEKMMSNSKIDNNSTDCVCSIGNNNLSMVDNENTTSSLKSSTTQLQNDPEVKGLYPLLSLESRHHQFSNIEPPSYEEQVQKEMQQLPQFFKQFDSICGTTDHHFINNAISNPSKKWIKKIQSEWTILKENLPESIYVRVYEDRMDLMRAVIVGAQGTPYHDGLFVFDLQLPQEFPLVPPVVYYHSGGLRLNPNLYENGNVCLSLLNTWRGKSTELWDASNSTILQLLISLQGLVLNVNPYFNEAGYERQIGLPEGEKNSLLYNENAFLLSCKSMLYLFRHPPQGFEPLIRQHFQQRGPMLLKACAMYMNGALVGSLDENLQAKADGSTEKSTAGFRIMLSKLLVKLTAEFAKLDGQSDV
ncbi:hypothetical protein KC19_7G091700, partial [Ceratodon purpureus]